MLQRIPGARVIACGLGKAPEGSTVPANATGQVSALTQDSPGKLGSWEGSSCLG